MSSPRIISGSARGVRLKSVPGDKTRPITDRVKENLFNIIGADVLDSTWLDLFAGTGSVGLEALSRGAKFVQFLDKERSAINTINSNLEHTRLSKRGKVNLSDAFNYLKRPPPMAYDYIYIAPPQYQGMWKMALAALDHQPGWVSEDGWIIVQINPIEYSPQTLEQYVEFDQRRYGSTLLLFLSFITRQSE